MLEVGGHQIFVLTSCFYLKTNPTRPLVLHTMPLGPPSTPIDDPQLRGLEAFAPKPQSRAKAEKSTTSVTKLISVVEIIKREFPKALRSHISDTSADDSKETTLSPDLFSLHQYNEVGCLEDLDPPTEEELPEERAERIIVLLGGKNQ